MAPPPQAAPDTGAFTGTFAGSCSIRPVPAFRDNYIWLLTRGGAAVAVDPGDAAPVAGVLQTERLRLDAILVTHHHPDHVGGVLELARASGARVLGPASEAIAGVTVGLRGGDHIELLGEAFDVISVPGHTLGHLAYWSRALAALFCGDTLFGCGCGRLFEGSPAQMLDSLDRLAALPDDTRVYCAHEYTLSNIRFALAVDPDNPELAVRQRECELLRSQNRPTVPSTLAIERMTNPFLRCNEEPVRTAAERRAAGAGASRLACFTAIRAWKNEF